MATKKLRDLRIGDKLALSDPDGIGRVTGVRTPKWIKLADGPAIEVEWCAKGESDWYVGDPDESVRIV